MTIHAVLFDLDGTLADTARDLLEAMNLTLAIHSRPLVSYDEFRQSVAYGTDEMIKQTFHLNSSDALFDSIKQQFLKYYEQCLGKYTTLFDGMNTVLNYFDSQAIPWGIVTNKLTRFTLPLLQTLHLEQRAQCIVAGDTLPYMKPHPEPLLHACRLLNSTPSNTLYVGDYIVDVEAAEAAQMQSLIITNYYHHPDENPYDWKADFVVAKAVEIIVIAQQFS